MEDLISRQAAIDYADDVPYIKDHPNVGLLWKAWLEQLPSAQPEIIRCKDCKHWGKRGLCEKWDQYISNEDFYCGCAERRTDE